jgi:hypothetical protein
MTAEILKCPFEGRELISLTVRRMVPGDVIENLSRKKAFSLQREISRQVLKRKAKHAISIKFDGEFYSAVCY